MSVEDKLAVAETVYRYATGVDTRNWPLYRSIFADEVMFDFATYNGRPPAVMDADAWVAGVIPIFTGLAVTQHSMSNPLVMLDGDTAAITMYMRALHIHNADDPASWFTIGGHYNDTLVRAGDRWLITGVQLVVTYRQGDPGIMERARADGHAELARRAKQA